MSSRRQESIAYQPLSEYGDSMSDEVVDFIDTPEGLEPAAFLPIASTFTHQAQPHFPPPPPPPVLPFPPAPVFIFVVIVVVDRNTL
jgi:hypothetical protein